MQRSRKPRRNNSVILVAAFLCMLLPLVFLLRRWERPTMNEAESETSTEAAPTATEETLPFDLSDSALILVNRETPLPEDYAVDLTRLKDWDASVATVLYADLCDLLAGCAEQGLHLTVCSAYRTRETQETLWKNAVSGYLASGMSQAEAELEAEKFHMQPGYSEHESGLALDLVSLDYQLLDDRQAATPECRWLAEHAWEYGFVLRYPEAKTDVTGVCYEPWHFRYVGKAAARYLTEKNLTLEELYAEEGKP